MTPCTRCHRPLRAEASRARGYGPKCDPAPELRATVRPTPTDVAPGQLGLFDAPPPPYPTGPQGDCYDCGGLPWGPVCLACAVGLVCDCSPGEW